ncbi:MAG: DNA polymerase III subunit gamma/tau [Rhodospirillales bacterium RIFCSPLOWO2_12_FULL_67_15]|nr:MAG: DNA polymerase III subunit gamma/tau [Rhodospirillales bacterium RIFCSPLOWO2_12_FULL_67_15]
MPGPGDREPSASAGGAYRVLARKYRHATFADLIGQEAMVRTLTNALRSGRLAHAFVLTGVRGVGKTTTARIIARALNCVGPDGQGGPTAEPCGACEHCRAIAEDRHVDVLEMDAASRTGVDEIRELIEGVRYRPTSARYKIYIVDEVHMLSKNAFNALLKTLEEPPPHVKFVFATTEIRKVPVTVLSRCQRFDLRRIDESALRTHFRRIADREGARIAEAALGLIARAADGSVRDGLSLLDQAISHVDDDGPAAGESPPPLKDRREDSLAATGEVTEAEVRAMLGLADRTLTFDLVEAALAGDGARALGVLALQHEAGAEAAQTIEDALGLVHWLTRIKLVPEAADDPAVPELERKRGRTMADALAIPSLARAWQILLKGLGETRAAPNGAEAAAMALVRLAYASSLPTPEEAIRALVPQVSGPMKEPTASPLEAKAPAAPAPAAQSRPPSTPRSSAALAQPAAKAEQPVASSELAVESAAPSPPPALATFAQVAALAQARKEGRLASHLLRDVHVVRFEPGRIEFRPGEHAPDDLAQQLSRFLQRETARTWLVGVSAAAGARTLAEEQAAARASLRAELAEHPFVKAVQAAFPGARLEEVRAPRREAAEPPAEDPGADEEPDGE